MALMLGRPTNFKYIQDFQYMSVSCVPFVILVLFVKVEINHHKFEKLPSYYIKLGSSKLIINMIATCVN